MATALVQLLARSVVLAELQTLELEVGEGVFPLVEIRWI
jgi:hypothetical protein